MSEPTLESQLFDWEGWDEMDIMAIMFHDITLKKDICKFKKGDKFDWADINFQTSKLEFGNKDTPEVINSFKLKLDVISKEDLE